MPDIQTPNQKQSKPNQSQKRTIPKINQKKEQTKNQTKNQPTQKNNPTQKTKNKPRPNQIKPKIKQPKSKNQPQTQPKQKTKPNQKIQAKLINCFIIFSNGLIFFYFLIVKWLIDL